MRARRVFWLGAHKVLKRTELRALRALGLEVFNPAYLSPVYDQSADLVLDRDQPSTLPPDVFAALLRHDFFYRPIEPGIAELLNAYFDAAIVTINPDWLRELLAVFKGQVIYRVYGQPYSLSETLVHNRMWDTLIARPGFTVVPFAAESVEHEHRWFLDLCQPAVPYQIPEDTFAFSGTWAAAAHRPEIATSIPNVQNPYYAAAYDAFNARFPHRLFRIYGPQRQVPADSRIVGALARGNDAGTVRGVVGVPLQLHGFGLLPAAGRVHGGGRAGAARAGVAAAPDVQGRDPRPDARPGGRGAEDRAAAEGRRRVRGGGDGGPGQRAAALRPGDGAAAVRRRVRGPADARAGAAAGGGAGGVDGAAVLRDPAAHRRAVLAPEGARVRVRGNSRAWWT